MLVLIDESGCSGFKLDAGSTPYFAVAMVIFDDYAQAEETSVAIAAERLRQRIKPEFKFSKCSFESRDAFFQAVSGFRFRVRVLIVPKNEIYSLHLQTNTKQFYNFFIQQLIRHDNNVLVGAKVKIDGSGDRRFKQSLIRYLRKQIGPGKIEKVKFANSRSDNLIQLADMCVGAIARSYRPDIRKDANRWHKMLIDKIEDLWEFG